MRTTPRLVDDLLFFSCSFDNQEAIALWEATNNTVGFNHMVASAPDAASYLASKSVGPGVAVAMETMYDYTAYFTDNDSRSDGAPLLRQLLNS